MHDRQGALSTNRAFPAHHAPRPCRKRHVANGQSHPRPHTPPPPPCGRRLARAGYVRGLPLFLFLLSGCGQTSPWGPGRSVVASVGRAGGSAALVRDLCERRWRTDHHRPHHPPPVHAPAGDVTTEGSGTRQPHASLKELRANDSLRGRQSPGMSCRGNQPSLLFIGFSRQSGPKLLIRRTIFAGSANPT